MNLATSLTDTAAAHGDSVAVITGAQSTTYSELDDLSARMAGLLRSRGVDPGASVGLMLPNVTEFAAAYYGILRAGGVVVPMNPLLKRREVEYYLADSGAEVLVAWHSTAPEVLPAAAAAGVDVVLVDPESFGEMLTSQAPARDVIDRSADDTAVLLYTSGTTGRPKGAELTHGSLRTNADITREDLLELGPDDVVFGGLPLFHCFGQTVALNTSVGAGATLVLLPRFDAATALRLLVDHRVTVFAGVPTMYSALLGVPGACDADVSALRVSVSGGAALPVEVLRRFEDTFGAIVLEGYGLSETSPVAAFNHPDAVRKPGSIGTPIRGVEMRLVGEAGEPVAAGEVGEIAIRGHNVMKGYRNRPEATAEVLSEDGWFRTGDVGRLDEDGFFYIVDRIKDVIIRGGYNVYPREIEEVLYEHPEVREVAVVGIAHAELGEEVGAAVALEPWATVTPEELRDYVKANVAAYKYPRRVWFVDDLPKGSTGKIQKRDLVVPE